MIIISEGSNRYPGQFFSETSSDIAQDKRDRHSLNPPLIVHFSINLLLISHFPMLLDITICRAWYYQQKMPAFADVWINDTIWSPTLAHWYRAVETRHFDLFAGRLKIDCLYEISKLIHFLVLYSKHCSASNIKPTHCVRGRLLVTLAPTESLIDQIVWLSEGSKRAHNKYNKRAHNKYNKRVHNKYENSDRKLLDVGQHSQLSEFSRLCSVLCSLWCSDCF